MTLTEVQQRFVLHWGEMGTKWGINRTVAQIHALLYVTGQPLAAETIAETLQIARSNVSTSVRELQSWGLVRIVHVMGDRRDHFESLSDVWEMFLAVLDERKRREVDPTVRVLSACVADLSTARRKSDRLTRDRIAAMLDFFQQTSSMYDEMRRTPQGLLRFARLGGKLRRLLAGAT